MLKKKTPFNIMLVNASDLGTKKDKKGQYFSCIFCDYITTHIGHWDRHLKTNKHQNRKMLVNASSKKKKGQKHKKYICNCGKAYLHDSSFYRHKLKCKTTMLSSQYNNNNVKEMYNTICVTEHDKDDRNLIDNIKKKK